MVYQLSGSFPKPRPCLACYAAARAYLLGGGLAYLALWVAGILVDHTIANFGPVNGADHWLHFGLGAAMVILGLTLAGQRDPTKRRR